MVPKIIWLIPLLMTSCSLNFSGPLTGPLLLNAQIRPNVANEVFVAITNASLKRHLRSDFLKSSDELYSTLDLIEGYIGGSLRVEPFGNQAWTLTIWKDKEAMNRFVLGQAHMAAAFTHGEAIIKFRSADFIMESQLIPNVWDKAMEKLDEIPKESIPQYY